MVLTLFVEPGFELVNGGAFGWQFDVGVDRLRIVAERMAHEGHADFPQDASFEQPGVEGVPQVVETAAADARPAEGGSPGSLDRADGLALEGEDQAFVLPHLPEEVEEPGGQRDLPCFAFRSLAVTYKEQPPGEIDVLPALGLELTPAHPGVEGGYDHAAEVGCGGGKELWLFLEAEHRTLPLPFPFEPHTAQGVRQEQAFVDGKE
jgi:hypothetical protein